MSEIKIMGPRGDIGVMSHKSNEGMIEREPRLIVKWCRVAAPEESSESLPGHGVKIPPAEPMATQPLPTVATHDPDSSPVVDAKYVFGTIIIYALLVEIASYTHALPQIHS